MLFGGDLRKVVFLQKIFYMFRKWYDIELSMLSK